MTLEDLYRLLRAGHVQAQGVVDTMTQAIVVIDRSMCVTTANTAFLKEFAVERDDMIGENFFELGNGQWDIPELRELIASVIPKAAAVIGYEVKHDFPTIGQRTFLVDARRLVHPDDNSTSVLVLFDDVTERQRHDAERDFIMSETRHRMKNLLAIIRSLAVNTEAEGVTGVEYKEHFLGRLEATLRAQEIAAASEATDLKHIITQSVGDVGSGRIRCEGPPYQVPSKTITPLTMIFHELATNAVKYGALSNPDGRIRVSWSLQTNSGNRSRLRLEWREEDGPQIGTPTRKGYGSQLMEGTCKHLGGSLELNYEPTGLVAKIDIPA